MALPSRYRTLIADDEQPARDRMTKLLAEYTDKIEVPDGPLVGYGIQNTQERIALLYGSEAAVNWKNGAEKYIEISIPV